MGKRKPPPVGGFDSMTLEEWERVKAENWARRVPDGEAPTRRRATLADGPIAAIKASMPIVVPSGDEVGRVSWSLAAQPVRVADVHVPAQIEATFYGGPHAPRVDLTIEVRNGVPDFTRVEVASEAGQPVVLTKHLQLAAGRLTFWRDLILDAAAQDRDDAPPSKPSWADKQTTRASVAGARRPRRRSLTAEHLAEVAELYRAHVDGEPVKAIEKYYGVPERTAARWVQMCRSDEYQLLPKTQRGQRKA